MRRLATAVVLALAVALAACRGDTSAVVRARDVVADDDRFHSANVAAEAFADAAEILLAAGKSCDSCPGVLDASAFTQILALRVLECTQPGVFDARAAVLNHLDALERSLDAAEPPPSLPVLPRC